MNEAATQQSTTEPSPVDLLKRDRAAKSAEVQRITIALTKLDAVKREVAAAEAEIAALNTADGQAYQRWAMGGGVAETPEIDHRARKAALERLARAQASFHGAAAAYGGLVAQRRAESDALNAVQMRIETIALDTMKIERDVLLKDFVKFIDTDIKPKLTALMSLHAFLADTARLHQAGGRSDQAREFFQHAESVSGVPPLDFDPTVGDVIADAKRWARRFSSLTADPPAEVVAFPGCTAA